MTPRIFKTGRFLDIYPGLPRLPDAADRTQCLSLADVCSHSPALRSPHFKRNAANWQVQIAVTPRTPMTGEKPQFHAFPVFKLPVLVEFELTNKPRLNQQPHRRRQANSKILTLPSL